ncbi:MAG TPA: methyltransferase domain-containing protein [Vicinamibacterales bacterium]|nr:methyltransferase domain-containing protein [Vicinamibacterales bacterium]
MNRRLIGRVGALLVAALVLTTVVRVRSAAQPGVHPISGRMIAPVMGYQGADWLERTEREDEEAPDLALRVLGIPKGATVADIGAGTGYVTVRLAARVGKSGMVFANDVQPQMLSILQRRLTSAHITNVTLVQGAIDDPRLPLATFDYELLVDVYHEFSQPQAMLRHLRESLKPDGRLVLLEYRKEDPTIPIKFEHKMSVAEAKLEVEAEGLKLSKVDESLPRQHILIFTQR